MEESTENSEATLNSISNDLAAQREARRKRILQNSNNRLGKITGRVHDEEQEANNTENSKEVPEHSNSSPIEEIFPDPEMERDVFESHAENQDIFELLRGININNPEARTSFEQQQQTREVPETFLQKLVKTKLPIVLIAIIVYFLFASNSEFLVGSNVFIVFLGWEVIEFLLLGSISSDGGGARNNYLSILFLLGGIPQRTSAILLKSLEILNKVLRDVAIFMFVFVLTHLSWSYLVINDSLSVILDKDFNVQIQDKVEL